jgi:diaminobutyrate-2-oxoglutarate transaminase
MEWPLGKVIPFAGAGWYRFGTRWLVIGQLGSLCVQDYLDRQQGYESNARTYPRRLPLAIRRAKGVRVTDIDGRVYLDCLAGAGTLALGHNHPDVVEAIRHHLSEDYPLHTLDLTTPVKDQFVEELFASLPAALAARAKIQFCVDRSGLSCYIF